MVKSPLVVVVDPFWLSSFCVVLISVVEYGADNDSKLEEDESTRQMQHTMAANGEVRVYCEGKKVERKHDLNRRGRANAQPKKGNRLN